MSLLPAIEYLDPLSLGIGAIAGGLIGGGIGYSLGHSQAMKSASSVSASEVTGNLKKMFGRYTVSDEGLLVSEPKSLESTSK